MVTFVSINLAPNAVLEGVVKERERELKLFLVHETIWDWELIYNRCATLNADFLFALQSDNL